MCLTWLTALSPKSVQVVYLTTMELVRISGMLHRMTHSMHVALYDCPRSRIEEEGERIKVLDCNRDRCLDSDSRATATHAQQFGAERS